MTRKEAIKLIQNLIDQMNEDGYAEIDAFHEDALLMAIKELEQEPCEDYVSRVSAINAVSESLKHTFVEYEEVAKGIINKLPSVKPQEPKTGHWIEKEGREQGYDIAGIKTWYMQIMCDKCGFIKTAIEWHIGQYHFCPNCGAKMIEEE